MEKRRQQGVEGIWGKCRGSEGWKEGILKGLVILKRENGSLKQVRVGKKAGWSKISQGWEKGGMDKNKSWL